MWRRGKEFWRKSGKTGATLPFVICAGALLIAFALALTYTAGLMLANANRKMKEERCYQLAKSFAKVLDEELLVNNGEAVATDTEGGFRSFVNQFLNRDEYSEYSADNPDTIYRYVLLDGAGDYGDIEIRLRKGKDADENEWQALSSGSGSSGTTGDGRTSGGNNTETSGTPDYSAIIAEKEKQTFRYYTLTVDVIAEYDGISYQYTTEYVRTDTYSLEYQYDVSAVVWDAIDGCWKYGNTSGDPVSITEGSAIQYRYKMGDGSVAVPTTTQFKLVHEERGSGESGEGGESGDGSDGT